MRGQGWRGRARQVLLMCALGVVAAVGCKALSDRLTRWQMLGGEAVEDPLQAVGGDGDRVRAARGRTGPATGTSSRRPRPQDWSPTTPPSSCSSASTPRRQQHPYPPEYDVIGEAQLRREATASSRPSSPGRPKVYAIFKKRRRSTGTTTSSSPTRPGIRPTRA